MTIINQIKDIILKHTKTDRIYLYGSFIDDTTENFSDIDIAFDDKDFTKLSIITEEINKLNSLVKIDVKNLAFAEERFINRVKLQGKIIYSASKKLRAEDGLYNFTKAVNQFEKILNAKDTLYKDGYNDFYLDVLVKRFEFTYEMSWKAIKRFLEYNGITCNYPRNCFKEAYAQKLITDETIWLEMIESRNLTAHVYNEFEITPILDRVSLYLIAFLELKNKLEEVSSD
ncbi:MAG: HI0074 family nucleotidyltransferase substrate-binding subunit [bacterium]